ncbi:hypothetical protein [Streptomyces sp. KL116D]|uniref:hypothetical protein n=1 Tax=Streptomyces sp. KL116D TaxID=3045152 RepID=UPI0035570DB7
MNSALDGSKAWDVTDVSTADSAAVQLWSYSSGANQQWLARRRGRRRVPLREPQQRQGAWTCPPPPPRTACSSREYTCNGTAAQSLHVRRRHDRPAPGTPTWVPTSPSSTRRCRRQHPVQAELGLRPAGRPTSSARPAEPCCSSGYVQRQRPTSASTPRSRASVSPRTT